MNTLSTLLKSSVAFAAFAALGTAQATITVYTTQFAFLGASGEAATDTFEDLGAKSFAGPVDRTVGPYGYTASAGTSSTDFRIAGAFNVWLTTAAPEDTITFDGFTGGVSAVGGRFFGSDSAGHIDPGQSLMLTATDASGSVSQTLVDAHRFSFLGFVSDNAITSLTVSAVQAGGGVFPTVNNLVLASASAVPEPESYALLLAGLAGGFLLLKRRRPE